MQSKKKKKRKKKKGEKGSWGKGNIEQKSGEIVNALRGQTVINNMETTPV